MTYSGPELPRSPQAPVSPRPWRERRTSLVVGVGAALVAVAAAAYAVGRGSAHGQATSHAPSSTAASLDRNGTCAAEVVVAAGVLHPGDSGVMQVVNAIGQESEQFRLALHLQVTMNQEIQRAGVSEALPAIAEEARHLCAQQGDPLLTAGQLESLKQIVPTDNAAALSGIRMFA